MRRRLNCCASLSAALITLLVGCGGSSKCLDRCVPGFRVDFSPPLSGGKGDYEITLDDGRNTVNCAIAVPEDLSSKSPVCELGLACTAFPDCDQITGLASVKGWLPQSPLKIRVLRDGEALADGVLTLQYHLGTDEECGCTFGRGAFP